tara:strand:- start:1910 stop:2590 length:681 start_codon:yes stop_codon:yes gene_type:complete
MNIESLINKVFRQDQKIIPNICYSQNGEDLILNRLLDNKSKGFYIDIGAHHPLRFSNTHFFYKKGWNGINIDAMPGSMKLFKSIRKRDINLETGIGDKKELLTYYKLNEPALNTFDRREVDLKIKKNYKLIDSLTLSVDRLDNILEKYLKINQEIDFMNIDVEGKDKEVLLSNNWKKFRPKFILIEILNEDKLINENCEINKYLEKQGYSFINKAIDTCIFRNNSI